MWKVVLWLNVVWSLYAVDASTASHDDPYLYVISDGVALMETFSIPIYGNGAGNKTTYLINNNLTLVDQKTIRGQPQRWEGISESIGPAWQKPSSESHYLRKHGFQKYNKLTILQKTVKFDEERQCVDGKTKFVKCNHCICMGGQLYVCTARKCASEKKLQKERGLNHVAFKRKSSCIEGEQIRSFDSCNRCYCGGGQVICTRKKCLEGSQNRTQAECIPGKRVKSTDNCNTCSCNTRGIIVCTVKTCGPEITKHAKSRVCIPNTWYSPHGSSKCKECYCINGRIAFCYMNLCARNSAKHTMLSLPGKCQMHDYIQDKCTRCDCGANGVWSCQTKNIHKTCTDAVPEQLQNYNRGKMFHRRQNIYPQLPGLSKILPEGFYELFKTTHKPKQTTKATRTTKQDYDRTIELEPTEIPFSGEYSGLPYSGEKMFPEYTDSSGGPGGIGHSERPDSSGGGGGKFPPGKGPEPSTRPDNYFSGSKESAAPGIDTNVDRGPYCMTGQFFTQGSDRTCHGCFCTPSNEWKCWSIKNACRGSSPCNTGKMKRNSVAPCSVCYCGADRKNYCATDELCSYSIQPSKCEAIACLNYCARTNANFGVCHEDKCVCVH